MDEMYVELQIEELCTRFIISVDACSHDQPIQDNTTSKLRYILSPILIKRCNIYLSDVCKYTRILGIRVMQ